MLYPCDHQWFVCGGGSTRGFGFVSLEKSDLFAKWPLRLERAICAYVDLTVLNATDLAETLLWNKL